MCPEYTLAEAKEVCAWLNEPKDLMNAFDRLYNAVARYHYETGLEPKQIKLEEVFYYEVLRDSPSYVFDVTPQGKPAGTFMGIPYTRVKQQEVDYAIEGASAHYH